jgi:hypothetical protein
MKESRGDYWDCFYNGLKPVRFCKNRILRIPEMAEHEVLTTGQSAAAQPQSFLSRPLSEVQNWLSSRSSIHSSISILLTPALFDASQFPRLLCQNPYQSHFISFHFISFHFISLFLIHHVGQPLLRVP